MKFWLLQLNKNEAEWIKHLVELNFEEMQYKEKDCYSFWRSIGQGQDHSSYQYTEIKAKYRRNIGIFWNVSQTFYLLWLYDAQYGFGEETNLFLSNVLGLPP